MDLVSSNMPIKAEDKILVIVLPNLYWLVACLLAHLGVNYFLGIT